MSKFARKEKVDAKEVVAKDSKLKIMAESSKEEKKEVAKRQAAKKAAAPVKEKTPKALKSAEKAINEKLAKIDNRKIKLLTKDNPKREGSESFKRYELYRTCKTVADFVTAGGTTADVRYDEQKGYIEVA